MATSWTDPGITSGTTIIKRVHIEELRTSLCNEQTRRGITKTVYDVNDNTVKAVHFHQIEAAATDIKSFSLSAGIIPGNVIVKTPVDELRAKINTLENSPTFRSDHVSDCNAACTGLCSSSCTGTSICHGNHGHGEY